MIGMILVSKRQAVCLHLFFFDYEKKQDDLFGIPIHLLSACLGKRLFDFKKEKDRA